jgi:hypothetical protein
VKETMRLAVVGLLVVAATCPLDADSLPELWTVGSNRWTYFDSVGVHGGHFAGIAIGPDGRVYNAGDLGQNPNQIAFCSDPELYTMPMIWADTVLQGSNDQIAIDAEFSAARHRFYIGGDDQSGNNEMAFSLRVVSDTGVVEESLLFKLRPGLMSHDMAISDSSSVVTYIWGVGECQGAFGKDIALWCARDSADSIQTVRDTSFGEGGSDQIGYAVAPNPTGDTVYVAGVTQGPPGTHFKFWVNAYSRTLDSARWEQPVVWTDGYPDMTPCDLLVAPDGALYVVGSGQSDQNGDNGLVVLKLDRATGAFLGSGWYAIAQGYTCRDADIMQTQSGYSIWATGNISTGYVCTAKFSSDLSLVAVDSCRPGGRHAGGDAIWCGDTTAPGKVYVAGQAWPNSTGGDYITVGDVEGTVEVVGMRVSKIRAFNGTLHTVPNGELTRFGNQSRGHMRAIVALDLAYEQNAEKGMALAREVAEQWYKENADNAIEPPVVAGLLKFGEAGVQVRVAVKVKPGRQWEAEQQLRLRLKQAFDSSGTEFPSPRRVVHIRSDSETGSQPKA